MKTPEARQSEVISHQNGLEQTIGRYKQSDSFLDLSENTRSAYTADLTQFQAYCKTQDISEVSKIESEDIKNWYCQLRQAGKAPATNNRKRSSLSSFFKWAQAEGIIQPDFTMSLPRYESVEKKQPRILSAEQADSLISKAKNLRDASLILIALATGASIKEIVNLNREDILKTRNGNIAIRFKGIVKKAQPRKREVDKKAGSKIAEYIKKSRLKPEDPLFKGFRDGYGRGRLTRVSAHQILERYGGEIGVEHLNPRILRDTFIANFTGSPRELDAILGRRNPRPSRSTYSPRPLLKI